MRLPPRSKHPELATAPFLLWGMSAGGEFNYEFVCWKPERVVAFVVNKGNIYYTALAPKAARSVPAILFTGGKDLEFRTSTITGLFAVNRRAGALWALAEEPSAAHVVGRSRDVALVLFEDALALRLGGGAALKPMTEKSGFLGDIKAKTFEAIGEAAAPNYPTAWLPTAAGGRAMAVARDGETMTRHTRPILFTLVALCIAPLALRPLAQSGHAAAAAGGARVRDLAVATPESVGISSERVQPHRRPP